MKPLLVGAYVAAVLSCALLAALGQTQFNLYALAALGAPISLELRLLTTGQDLLGFTPTFVLLSAPALLIALPGAGWISRRINLRWLIFAAAGALAIASALLLANWAVPMPTLIAADRYPLGRAMFMLCGALGALLFAWLTRPTLPTQGKKAHV